MLDMEFSPMETLIPLGYVLITMITLGIVVFVFESKREPEDDPSKYILGLMLAAVGWPITIPILIGLYFASRRNQNAKQ